MRSPLIVALLAATVLAFPTPSASEDVQELGLRVRGLTAPSGKQVATLTGRVAPSNGVRAVTATLDVGGTTATLTGKIGRSGRMKLIGRRLDLATALAAFDEIAVDVSGGLTSSIVFDSGDCVLSLRGRLLDCQGGHGPIGELLDGVYDLAIGSSLPPTSTGPGRFTTLVDGSHYLTLYESALDFASLTTATDFTLSGYHILGGDAFVSVSGSAQNESTASASRLSGSYTGGGFVSRVFAMERPLAGTPSTLGGTWTLALQTSRTMTLTLAVASDGTATSAATTIDNASGGTIYTVRAGTCDVAPSGGLHCLLGIDNPPGAQEVRLHGVLDDAGDAGQGTFAIGPPPGVSAQGTWTATR